MVPENDANITAGWWYTYPSEKYESQLGLLFPMYGKKCSKPPTRLGGNQNHPKEPTGSVGKAAMAVSVPCKDSHGS